MQALPGAAVLSMVYARHPLPPPHLLPPRSIYFPLSFTKDFLPFPSQISVQLFLFTCAITCIWRSNTLFFAPSVLPEVKVVNLGSCLTHGKKCWFCQSYRLLWVQRAFASRYLEHIEALSVNPLPANTTKARIARSTQVAYRITQVDVVWKLW